SRQKALLAEAAVAEARQIAAARRRLATGTRTRLSDLHALDATEFDLFLAVLGETLTSKVRADERAEVVATDGPVHRPRQPPGAQLEQATAAERRRALRVLVQHPLLSAAGPLFVEFGLVRRHAAWLRDWLARHPGWSLQIDSETARLRKTPADLDDRTRPAR